MRSSGSPGPSTSGRPRVASLIASGTEIVAELGFGDALVGVSHECDYPPAVSRLPRLSAAKVASDEPSAEIDRGVRRLAADGESAYLLHVGEIERLRPDVIVTQDVCEVCAVALPDVSHAIARLDLPDTRVCSLTAVDLDGVLDDFVRVGRALGVPERGERLASRTRERLDRLGREAGGASGRPRVAFIEWLDPPMIAGGWIPELAWIAGCQPVIVDRPDRFVQVAWSDIEKEAPDYVVFVPCGFTASRTLEELEVPSLRDRLRSIRTLVAGQGLILDGHSYFNRPGPRLAEGAEVLASLLRGIPVSPRTISVERPFIPWRLGPPDE